jgi:hypothetical protein
MTISNNYCSVAELKAVLGIPAADTADDSKMETVIMAVSRQIDGFTGRRFYTTSAAETRAYTAQDYNILFLPDDLNSLTSLKTDQDGDGVFETTWATTDYTLMPKNASLDSKPYTYIIPKPLGSYTFPSSIPNSVQVVGKFGWGATSSAPNQVKQACIIQSERIFKRKDAPFGVVGSGDFGTVSVIPAFDPDVKDMLMSVSRRV